MVDPSTAPPTTPCSGALDVVMAGGGAGRSDNGDGVAITSFDSELTILRLDTRGSMST